MKLALDSREPIFSWRPSPGLRQRTSASTWVASRFAPGAGKYSSTFISGGFVSGSGSVTNLGGAIDQPGRTAINTFQWVDNISHTTARHGLQMSAPTSAILNLTGF